MYDSFHIKIYSICEGTVFLDMGRVCSLLYLCKLLSWFYVSMLVFIRCMCGSDIHHKYWSFVKLPQQFPHAFSSSCLRNLEAPASLFRVVYVRLKCNTVGARLSPSCWIFLVALSLYLATVCCAPGKAEHALTLWRWCIGMKASFSVLIDLQPHIALIDILFQSHSIFICVGRYIQHRRWL